jgi:G3E family GTPase
MLSILGCPTGEAQPNPQQALVKERDSQFLSKLLSEKGTTSFEKCFQFLAVLQVKLNQFLSKLLSEKGTDIFRSKGVLAVKGESDK